MSILLWRFFLFLITIGGLQAQLPRTFSIQGVLSGTQFKSEHAHIITTTLYAVDSEDKSLYSQSDTLFIERNGLFTIQIGKDKGLPSSLSFDKQYVVEFTVNGSVMPMRIPLQSVPYAITSEKVSDNSVEMRHLSEGLKQQLQIQEDSKSGKGENTLANYVGGFRSVISGGDENRTSANFSSILGGYTNNVSGTYGTVAGGQSNSVSGNWSFVGGGQNNRAMGSWSSVTAGRDNTIASSATYAAIGGGITNQVGANNGTISGGSSNIVTAQGGTVSGGQSNRAMQTFATVSGGQNNIASGQGSVTAGGMNNKATSQYSIVSGGSNNEANGNHAVVSGGMNNDANAEFSSIAGGNENVIASNARSSFISGGSNNKINSGMNAGVMGSNNTITSSNNSFVMGTGNTISNASNGIGIGTGNQVSGQNATAIGIGNIANANNEFVIGSYASTSSNPVNTSNTAFTGNKRFSVGIGSSSGQRKNAITVFENGNTLFQGKVLTTETAFLNSAEIINDVTIGGDVDVVGDVTVNGTLNATGQFNASNLSGTNTGDVTIGTANGLSMNGQILSLATATTTNAGAMSASDKVKLDGISVAGTSATHGFQTFTQTTTFQVPAGITQLYVQLWGGGGGGGSNRCGLPGGGGGSGGYVSATIAVVPGEQLELIIGNGGAPDQTNGGCNCGCDPNGLPGGVTKITRLGSSTDILIATGGGGGGGACRNGSTGWAGAVCAITSAAGGGGAGGSFVFTRGVGVFISSSINGNQGSGASGGNGVCVSGVCFGSGGNNMIAGSAGAVAIDW